MTRERTKRPEVKTPWKKKAKCIGMDPEIFYPGVGQSGSNQDAKAICNGHDGHDVCKVRDACLNFALQNGEFFGVWGGLDWRDRGKILRQGRKYIDGFREDRRSAKNEGVMETRDSDSRGDSETRTYEEAI